MIHKFLHLLVLATSIPQGAPDMNCIDITKDHGKDEILSIVNEHVIGKPVTDLDKVFCNKIFPVYFEDSTLAIHISIREVRGAVPIVHRFVIHLKSDENIVTGIVNIETGTLAP